MKHSRGPLRQGLGTLMALEIPKQQDQKENHDKHENAEVVPCSIRTTPLGSG